MKKIITVFVSILLLSGCACITKVGERYELPENAVTAIHFESEGHQYIWFVRGRSGIGVVHDPECWCMVDYD